MTIIYVSDFDLRGSGYMNLSVSLCTQLVDRGYDVLCLGLGYNGQEHYHPFKIVPTQLPYIVPMIRQLKEAIDIEAVVVALDIPLQSQLLKTIGAPSDIPYVGLFPLEAGPLCNSWALDLLRMDSRLVMSEFGQRELKDKGVDSLFIPIGIDTESWRQPTPDEYATLRQGLGVEDGTTVVLTVADNQERKNLSRSMEVFADFLWGFEVDPNANPAKQFTAERKQNRQKALYWLVTRPRSPVGWNLEDYAMDLGIMDRVAIWERGMPFKQLWSLYAAADVFLLTSKAEGLALPVLEAMSMRLPVIGTRCSAIEEHLQDGRGFLIRPDYVMRDPWGNSNRYMASREDGVFQFKLWLNGATDQDNTAILNRAQAYVHQREWDRAGDVLAQAIEQAKQGKQGAVINMQSLVTEEEAKVPEKVVA